jgi:hypothetical protein
MLLTVPMHKISEELCFHQSPLIFSSAQCSLTFFPEYRKLSACFAVFKAPLFCTDATTVSELADNITL